MINVPESGVDKRTLATSNAADVWNCAADTAAITHAIAIEMAIRTINLSGSTT